MMRKLLVIAIISICLPCFAEKIYYGVDGKPSSIGNRTIYYGVDGKPSSIGNETIYYRHLGTAEFGLSEASL